jgi:hypothetical protein
LFVGKITIRIDFSRGDEKKYFFVKRLDRDELVIYLW